MCNAYKLKTHEVSDGKASQLGEYLPSYLKMDEGEACCGYDRYNRLSRLYAFLF